MKRKILLFLFTVICVIAAAFGFAACKDEENGGNGGNGDSVETEHSLTPHSYADPTCTKAGHKVYYSCSNCDKLFSDPEGTNEVTLNDVTIPKLGHQFDEYIYNDDATCTKDGTKTATCVRCNKATDTKPEEGSATGQHIFTHYVSEGGETCLKGDNETAKCDYCDETDTREGALRNHKYVGGKCTYCDESAPTEGLEYIEYRNYIKETEVIYYAVAQGTATDKDIIIPSLYNGRPVSRVEHYGFQENQTIESVTLPASIEQCGYYAFNQCVNLKDVYYLGDVAGWCSIMFETSADNPITYADNLYIDGEIITELVIPDGVTSIGDLAFYGNKAITSVTMTDSVEYIGREAFAWCENLTTINLSNSLTEITGYSFIGSGITSITLPDGIKKIGHDAFSNCSNLASIQLNSGLETIEYQAFSGTGLTEIIIPDSVTSIGENAFTDSALVSVELGSGITELPYALFSNCYDISSVTIKGAITSIGEFAFNGCKQLTSFTVPATVTSIHSQAFVWCDNLTSLTVEDGNSVYHSAGNCIIETQSKTLLIGCKNGVIPADGSVTKIGDYAFVCGYLLTEMTIPSTVTSIGANAFGGSNYLSSITFEGTRAQWEAIIKGTDWDGGRDITVVCSDD